VDKMSTKVVYGERVIVIVSVSECECVKAIDSE
jgi:hypothetical protein